MSGLTYKSETVFLILVGNIDKARWQSGGLVKSHDVWGARMALNERGTWQLRQIDNGAADQAFVSYEAFLVQ
jgi:hypothetical protein